MSNLKKTDVRRITDHGEALKVQATYGIRSTNNDYFTVTLEGWSKYASTATDPRIAGCNHELAARAFPKLADLIALHLSDAETGAPMYAVENGWYWFREDGADRAANYLRTTPDKLAEVTTKDEFIAVVDGLRPQWAAEAEAAREHHGLND